MSRITRFAVISVGLFLVAWVVKKVIGSNGKVMNSDELLQRLRAHGV